MPNDEFTEEEVAAIQYRFSGYNLPMIQLDETGPSYIQLGTTHPYYRDQPEYWATKALSHGPDLINNGGRNS